MLSLNKIRKPSDRAPDWVGKTYGARIADCIVHLTLFEIINEREAAALFARVDKWRAEAEQREGQSNGT